MELLTFVDTFEIYGSGSFVDNQEKKEAKSCRNHFGRYSVSKEVVFGEPSA